MRKERKKKEKKKMVSVTCNIPEIYDKNIQKLIGMNILPSRSEGIRLALREYLQKEYNTNLKLLGFFNGKKEKK